MPEISAITGFGWRTICLHHCRALLHDVRIIRPAAIPVLAGCRHLLEIMPGTENGTFSGNYNDPHRIVIFTKRQLPAQGGNHLLGKCIALVRCIKNDPANTDINTGFDWRGLSFALTIQHRFSSGLAFWPSCIAVVKLASPSPSLAGSIIVFGHGVIRERMKLFSALVIRGSAVNLVAINFRTGGKSQ